ncbi:MAG: phage holin [Bacillales bacterium]|nr:phage holin [Bacillales bacterium]
MNSIKKQTIIRTVVLAAALINQGLTLSGLNPLPFEDHQIENFVAGLFTTGAAVWAWWKNNSFTKRAIAADEYKNELKGA